MPAVLGLGNPGDRYSHTRHNIGRDAVAGLIARLGAAVGPGRGEFVFARDPSRDLVMALNTTYMNASGVSAVDLLRYFEIEPADLLVVCDDFNLPFGTLRIRPGGGDGGHNGLGSIIASLGTREFPRLRIGIGPLPDGVDAADFVLSGFTADERERLDEIRAAAGEAMLAVFRDGLERAMSAHNRRVVE